MTVIAHGMPVDKAEAEAQIADLRPKLIGG
jgi:hypothetical protein